MKPKNKIILRVEDGLVQEVHFSSKNVEVEVWDFDVDTIANREAYERDFKKATKGLHIVA